MHGRTAWISLRKLCTPRMSQQRGITKGWSEREKHVAHPNVRGGCDRTQGGDCYEDRWRVPLRLHYLCCGNRSRQRRDMPLHGLPDAFGQKKRGHFELGLPLGLRPTLRPRLSLRPVQRSVPLGLVWRRIHHEGHEDHEVKQFKNINVRNLRVLRDLRGKRKQGGNARLSTQKPEAPSVQSGDAGRLTVEP